jgi:hypothetical protein
VTQGTEQPNEPCDCTCHRLLRRSTRIQSDDEPSYHEVAELFDTQWRLGNALRKAPAEAHAEPTYLGCVGAHAQLSKLFVQRASEVFGLPPETVDSVMRGQTDPARGAPSVDA